MEIFTSILLICVAGFLVWEKFFQKDKDFDFLKEKLKTENDSFKEQISRLNLEIEKKSEKLGEITTILEKEKSEKNELQGKNKQIFVNVTALQEKNQLLQQQLNNVQKKLTKIESEREQRTQEVEKRVKELENARKTLDDEKLRIRREDEEKIAEMEAKRDKMWNEHEKLAIIQMKEICQKKDLNFTFYENINLPETFDGSLKPDFLVEFLGQFIIFDAKMSRSANLQNYLNDQVKNTVKKIKASKNKEEIYPTIFFIIPTVEFVSLKKYAFFEESYAFFIVPIESFEAILSAYKKIMNYDLAESFDPKDRENIINLIASYDQHISKQNAINILNSLESLKLMHLKEILNKEMKEEIDVKKKKMRIDNFKRTDLKRLVDNPEEQINEIKKLVIPKKAEIKKKDLQNVLEIGLFDQDL